MWGGAELVTKEEVVYAFISDGGDPRGWLALDRNLVYMSSSAGVEASIVVAVVEKSLLCVIEL